VSGHTFLCRYYQAKDIKFIIERANHDRREVAIVGLAGVMRSEKPGNYQLA
jgi:hypothetical protein